ncbi:hypothetical protein IC744_16130 [Microbacterium hominis]|uniref:hypothetical protein n=1 Tax=Microbacterium hominis TaxID=162426 RepID=UPI00168B64C8|nr:hypothetical protein [Microbacterium hominis]QOC24791.1 hypothetical protein IC745_10375 [Microbacterium hominis]QOC28845.1 hypothetical protein IC744_16130 [Microbacterium hominis]
MTKKPKSGSPTLELAYLALAIASTIATITGLPFGSPTFTMAALGIGMIHHEGRRTRVFLAQVARLPAYGSTRAPLPADQPRGDV